MAQARGGIRWRAALLGVWLLAGVAQAGDVPKPAETNEKAERRKRCDKTRQLATKLEKEARALVVSKGCSEVSQCKSVPMGKLACGGPSSYLVYCSVKTDEAALQKKLSLLLEAHEQMSNGCGFGSICMVTREPLVELLEGVCKQGYKAYKK